MKTVSVVLILIFLTGCTTFRPIESSPEPLENRIISEKVIVPGDTVKVITTDGKHHKFRVVSITEDKISGKNIELQLTDIVSLETKKFSGGKTALLVGGSGALILLVSAIAVSTMAITLAP